MSKVHFIEDIAEEINKETRRRYQVTDNEPDFEDIGQKIRWFITNYDFLLLWRKRHGGIISYREYIFMLEYKIGRKVGGCKQAVEEILNSHTAELLAIDNRFPYPFEDEKITRENYLPRYTAITNLKKDSIKKLKEVLS